MPLERSAQLIALVNAPSGDYGRCQIDTRPKEKAFRTDLENIKKTVAALMAQNFVSLVENPIRYLWGANCVLFKDLAYSCKDSQGPCKDPQRSLVPARILKVPVKIFLSSYKDPQGPSKDPFKYLQGSSRTLQRSLRSLQGSLRSLQRS